MTEVLNIRNAVPEDAGLVLDFIKELAEYERLSDEVVATESMIEGSLFGERPYAEALIAEVDGKPAGFALFFHNFSTFNGRPGLYLEDLYVKPGLRGKGIGRSLLARLARIAKERNCARMEWAVLTWNEPAIGFYRRLGARQMADWHVNRLTGEELLKLASEDGNNRK